MRTKALLTTGLALFFLLTPHIVFAGSPPVPTQDYIDYINRGKVFVVIVTFLLLLAINAFFCSSIFRKFKVKISVSKLLLFTLIITFLTNISNYFLYTIILPETYSSSLFGGNSVVGGLISEEFSQINFLIILFFFLLNPAYLISFFVSFMSSRYLFKGYLKGNIHKKKIMWKISVIFLPLVGLIIASIFSELYCYLFPFAGVKHWE